jgi:hypothetical protein
MRKVIVVAMLAGLLAIASVSNATADDSVFRGIKTGDVSDIGKKKWGATKSSDELVAARPHIDTLLVWDIFSLDDRNLFGTPNQFNHNDLRPAIMKVINAESAKDGLVIKPAYNVPAEEMFRPNVASLEIILSGRKVEIPSKGTIKLASVSAAIRDTCKNCIFPQRAARYSVPFVISDDKSENLRQIQDAVRRLAPVLIQCLNSIHPDRCDFGVAPD